MKPTAGWYEDPRNKNQVRWWDGEKWTADTRAADSVTRGVVVSEKQPAAPREVVPLNPETTVPEMAVPEMTVPYKTVPEMLASEGDTGDSAARAGSRNIGRIIRISDLSILIFMLAWFFLGRGTGAPVFLLPFIAVIALNNFVKKKRGKKTDVR